MPPKVKITKEEIVKTAIDLIRSEGEEAVNARRIAAALGCSTQPVFSNFATMEALQQAMIEAAYTHYLAMLDREVKSGRYPPYKAFGMAYIRFAEEEKELFKMLFMCDRSRGSVLPTVDFEQSVEMIMQANSVSREVAELIHLEMWSCVHGIGTMLATSFCTLDRELISRMISDIYHGIQRMHQAKEER